jgi:hypothetical protein
MVPRAWLEPRDIHEGRLRCQSAQASRKQTFSFLMGWSLNGR